MACILSSSLIIFNFYFELYFYVVPFFTLALWFACYAVLNEVCLDLSFGCWNTVTLLPCVLFNHKTASWGWSGEGSRLWECPGWWKARPEWPDPGSPWRSLHTTQAYWKDQGQWQRNNVPAGPSSLIRNGKLSTASSSIVSHPRVPRFSLSAFLLHVPSPHS